jgi:hypothetical protein
MVAPLPRRQVEEAVPFLSLCHQNSLLSQSCGRKMLPAEPRVQVKQRRNFHLLPALCAPSYLKTGIVVFIEEELPIFSVLLPVCPGPQGAAHTPGRKHEPCMDGESGVVSLST